MRAAGDDAGALAAAGNAGPVARDVAGLHLQADELPARALGLHLLERCPADEIALAGLDRPAQTGLVRVDGLVHVVAPQPQSRLEAGGVARAESRRQHAGGPAVVEDRVPRVADLVGGDEQLETVLARVTRTRDQGVDAGDVFL